MIACFIKTSEVVGKVSVTQANKNGYGLRPVSFRTEDEQYPAFNRPKPDFSMHKNHSRKDESRQGKGIRRIIAKRVIPKKKTLRTGQEKSRALARLKSFRQ